jgi:hypothetical protein
MVSSKSRFSDALEADGDVVDHPLAEPLAHLRKAVHPGVAHLAGGAGDLGGELLVVGRGVLEDLAEERREGQRRGVILRGGESAHGFSFVRSSSERE